METLSPPSTPPSYDQPTNRSIGRKVAWGVGIAAGAAALFGIGAAAVPPEEVEVIKEVEVEVPVEVEKIVEVEVENTDRIDQLTAELDTAQQATVEVGLERDAVVLERDSLIDERDLAYAARDEAVAERDAAIGQRDQLQTELDTLAPPPASELEAPKSSGLYRVGENMAPGLWFSDGTADDCYWQISPIGAPDDIIDNHFGYAGGSVTLSAGTTFESNDCGTWALQK